MGMVYSFSALPHHQNTPAEKKKKIFKVQEKWVSLHFHLIWIFIRASFVTFFKKNKKIFQCFQALFQGFLLPRFLIFQNTKEPGRLGLGFKAFC